MYRSPYRLFKQPLYLVLAEKKGCLLLTKIKAHTVNTCLLCEIKKRNNWEHVEFDEGISLSFYPF